MNKKSKRFSDSLANQWLSLDTLGTMPPVTCGAWVLAHFLGTPPEEVPALVPDLNGAQTVRRPDDPQMRYE